MNYKLLIVFPLFFISAIIAQEPPGEDPAVSESPPPPEETDPAPTSETPETSEATPEQPGPSSTSETPNSPTTRPTLRPTVTPVPTSVYPSSTQNVIIIQPHLEIPGGQFIKKPIYRNFEISRNDKLALYNVTKNIINKYRRHFNATERNIVTLVERDIGLIYFYLEQATDYELYKTSSVFTNIFRTVIKEASAYYHPTNMLDVICTDIWNNLPGVKSASSYYVYSRSVNGIPACVIDYTLRPDPYYPRNLRRYIVMVPVQNLYLYELCPNGDMTIDFCSQGV